MPRRVLAKEGPDPIDVHVGNRVRVRRTLLGMSKSALGEALGLTSQQVYKYEHGVNRISASRLWRLTQVLGVPVSYFYDDMPARNRRESGHWPPNVGFRGKSGRSGVPHGMSESSQKPTLAAHETTPQCGTTRCGWREPSTASGADVRACDDREVRV